MPIKNKTVKTEINPTTYEILMDWGEHHGLPPRVATILNFLIKKALKPYRMPEVHKVLAIEGGDTESLRDNSIHEYLTRRGYLRKGK